MSSTDIPRRITFGWQLLWWDQLQYFVCVCDASGGLASHLRPMVVKGARIRGTFRKMWGWRRWWVDNWCSPDTTYLCSHVLGAVFDTAIAWASLIKIFRFLELSTETLFLTHFSRKVFISLEMYRISLEILYSPNTLVSTGFSGISFSF